MQQFEQAIRDHVKAVIVERYACDCIASEKRFGHGKNRLHAKLRDAKYELILSPPKRVTGSQGSTDVDVALSILHVAGAFAAQPLANALVLIAGDADFKPCIHRVLSARQDFHVYVVASKDAMGHDYKSWLDSVDRVHFIDINLLFGSMAPHVVDLRGAALPIGQTGKTDVKKVVRLLEKVAVAIEHTDTPLTLNISGAMGDTWGDPETHEFVNRLIDDTIVGNDPESGGDAAHDGSSHYDAILEILSNLGELWMHHTSIGDESCTALSRLISCAAQLRELHVSDTNITIEGLLILVRAAANSGCGEGRPRLYINARHWHGDEVYTLARESRRSCTVKLGSGHFQASTYGTTGVRHQGRGYRGTRSGRGAQGRAKAGKRQ